MYLCAQVSIVFSYNLNVRFVTTNSYVCMCVCVFFSNLITYVYEGHMRGLLLTRKRPDQVFLVVKLKSSFRKSYDDLVDRYIIIFVSQMTRDMFHCRNHLPVLSSFVAYRQVCNKSNTTGVTCEARTAGVHSWFLLGLCCHTLVPGAICCRSLSLLFGHCIVYPFSIYGF